MPSPYDALKTLRKLTKATYGGARLGSLYSRDGGLTDTQIEIMPYLQEMKARKKRKGGLLQPIETIFDLLNRGQYVTANIAQQITDNVNQGREWWQGVPGAIKEGLTGARKGDWEKVLFGGEMSGETVEGWIPWRPETKAGKIAKGVAGFGANVFFDPTTYTGFGPATAAKNAARGFADDAVKLSLREISKSAKTLLPKMIQKGYSKKVFEELLEKNAPKGFAYLSKYGGQDVTKHLSKVWKESYQHALRTPAGKLTEEATTRVKGMMGAAPDVAQVAGKTTLGTGWNQLEELLPMIEAGRYGGAGQRAGRFMRKEFAVGERNPTWLQAMDKMRAQFGKSKIGGAFSDAWWAIANSPKSPVATIRKALRIRNPYQKMLSIMDRDITYRTAQKMSIYTGKLQEIIEPLTQDQMDEVVGSMVISQTMQEQGKRLGKVSPAGETIARHFTDEKNADVVVDAMQKLNALTGEWDKYNKWAFDQGLAGSVGHWEDYLPIAPGSKGHFKKSNTKLGSAHPGWTKARSMGWGGHIEQDLEKIKWMFGVDTETAYKALSEGKLGDINLNLQDMMMRRAFAQARFEQHVDMVQKFKEFGIDVKSLEADSPEIYASIAGKWGNLEPLGMKKIENAPGLEGIIFDREVADIFERALKATESDQALGAITKVFTGFTDWWRGWATLSPGFHARNFLSNNMTGYLKHGMEWLNPQKHAEAFVATVVALRGYDDGVQQLAKIFPEDWVKKTLAKRVEGGASLAELAEFGGKTGVAARMSMGFTEAKTYEDLVRMEGKLFKNVNINPMSREFVGTKGSRELGSYIESTAKMQSFILDYGRAVKQGADPGMAAEWAKNEARKWWIDYGDLTPTEQKLRQGIPFYSWIRGNLGNQMSGMMQFTEMYSMLPKATEAIRMEGGPEQQDYPEWMREGGYIPISESQEGLTRFFWPNFPYQDVNKIPIKFEMREGLPFPVAQDPQELLRDISQDAHPAIKSIIGLIGNVDVFRQTPLGETRKAPRLMRAFTKAPGMLPFLDGLLRTFGFQEGLRADVNDKGQLMIDSGMAYVLENNVLLLERIPKMMDPLMFIPAINKLKETITGAEDDYEGLERIFQSLSFYAGIKLKEKDFKEEEFRRNQELIEEARAERRRQPKYRVGQEQRSLKWKQQQTALQRRLGL